MDYLKELGSLALASRMKRVVDSLRQEVKTIYASNQVNFDVSLMPLMKLVDHKGSVEVNEASTLLGISQPAITQFCNKLVRRGLVQLKLADGDHRKRKISLTRKGREELKKLNTIWKSMSTVLDDILTKSDHNLIEALGSMETEMQQIPYNQRVEKHLTEARSPVEILDFTDELANHFKTLNYEWIEKYFEVEDTDEFKLSNPRKEIIDRGGFIYFAKQDGKIVGTTAMIKVSNGIYEIAKMAVTENHQKKGIGKKLLKHVLKKAKEQNFGKLVLYSNTNLAPAINMYFDEGFRVIPKDDHHNNRANIKMQLIL